MAGGSGRLWASCPCPTLVTQPFSDPPGGPAHVEIRPLLVRGWTRARAFSPHGKAAEPRRSERGNHLELRQGSAGHGPCGGPGGPAGLERLDGQLPPASGLWLPLDQCLAGEGRPGGCWVPVDFPACRRSLAGGEGRAWAGPGEFPTGSVFQRGWRGWGCSWEPAPFLQCPAPGQGDNGTSQGVGEQLCGWGGTRQGWDRHSNWHTGACPWPGTKGALRHWMSTGML